MARKWTKTEAFAHFGVSLTNVRWSWSGRTADGTTVVLALWSDRFTRKTSPIRYEGFRADANEKWLARPGNRERLENLIWARTRCNGLFRVVMVTPEDAHSDPREIAEAFPKSEMVMRITELDDRTGEFRAELV
jgi:hypothetical protein